MRRALHEIRNHLAVATANVEAFRDRVLEPTTQRLTAVLQALREVDALLTDLPLDGGTVPFETNARPINVCDIVTNEVLAFEAAAKQQNIELHVEQCTERDRACLNFAGDPVRVAEIVNNVMSNAIRYTPAGGRVEVDCRRSGGALTLTVTDDGPGISSGETPKIFDAGFRGAAAAGLVGSGAGLALVKRFVEAHGGTIDVDDAADRGARFTIRLPGKPLTTVPRRTDDGTISLL